MGNQCCVEPPFLQGNWTKIDKDNHKTTGRVDDNQYCCNCGDNTYFGVLCVMVVPFPQFHKFEKSKESNQECYKRKDYSICCPTCLPMYEVILIKDDRAISMDKDQKEKRVETEKAFALFENQK